MLAQCSHQVRSTTKTAAQLFPIITLLLGVFVLAGPAHPSDFPQARISNGQITATVYLPDPVNGYYRSTRFDWSGAVNSLQYKGHEFYGIWFDAVDPKVINKEFPDGKIVNGPPGALYGPVDEFQTPLGWNEAKPGGSFIKIGVGVLHREEGNYNRFVPYDIVNSGKWTVKKHNDSIEFQQEISDPVSGYSYIYRKIVRLEQGKPHMVIEHSLKNTGGKEIKSNVYNHNFLVLDKQTPGPDFTFKVPFEIKPMRPPDQSLAEVRGNQVMLMKQLSGSDEVAMPFRGFSESATDNETIMENQKVGAGVKITGDRPLVMDVFWSIRTVIAVEPYIAIDVQPGAEFTWKNIYEYYTLPTPK
jgi:hypothetical protein